MALLTVLNRWHCVWAKDTVTVALRITESIAMREIVFGAITNLLLLVLISIVR